MASFFGPDTEEVASDSFDSTEWAFVVRRAAAMASNFGRTDSFV